MSPVLSDAQLRAELLRCQSCETRPCRSGCPAGCSPADFIMAARCAEPSDYRRAAAHILAHNPLGGVCGLVCPDTLCMARCTRRALDGPVNIPAIQGAIIRKARQRGVLPRTEPQPATGQSVAVVGAGPAGLGAASVLAKAGHAVTVFDGSREPGGMARLIPRHRLDPEVLASDLSWLLGLGRLQLVLGKPVALPRDLLARGHAAVIVAGGLSEPVELDVPGSERALQWARVLGPRPPALLGKRVAIVGDGAVALDCAGAAIARGAAHVELFALKALAELAVTQRERDRLFASGLHLTCRVRVAAIRGVGRGRGGRVTGLLLRMVELPAGQTFHPSRLVDLRHGEQERKDFDAVILAVGSRPGMRREPHPRVFYAGDLESGPTTVVEALASGKRAALAVHRLLAGDEEPSCPDRGSCPDGSGCPKRATCPEWNRPPTAAGATPAPRATGLPVALDCDFLGRRLRSPFLLAPSPFTQGYAQVKRAYEAGWSGAVMSLPSGEAESPESLDRLRSDIDRLRLEFPDRLTLSSPEGGLAGDPTDYRGAVDLLALGAMAVLIDAPVRRHGLGIVNELQGGLSYFLAERGMRSVSELVGSAPDGHGALTGAPAAAKARCVVDPVLCTGCGNCARCPYCAITLDASGIPAVDADLCTGCALCLDQCQTGAIAVMPYTRA